MTSKKVNTLKHSNQKLQKELEEARTTIHHLQVENDLQSEKLHGIGLKGVAEKEAKRPPNGIRGHADHEKIMEKKKQEEAEHRREREAKRPPNDIRGDADYEKIMEKKKQEEAEHRREREAKR